MHFILQRIEDIEYLVKNTKNMYSEMFRRSRNKLCCAYLLCPLGIFRRSYFTLISRIAAQESVPYRREMRMLHTH